MITARVKIIFNRFSQIQASKNAEIHQMCIATGLRILTRMKVAMAEQKTGRQYQYGSVTHIASAPGEAPAVDTGELFGSLKVEAIGQRRVIVYTDKEYAPPLEFGSVKMAARPFMKPAAEAERSRFYAEMAAILRS